MKKLRTGLQSCPLALLLAVLLLLSLALPLTAMSVYNSRQTRQLLNTTYGRTLHALCAAVPFPELSGSEDVSAEQMAETARDYLTENMPELFFSYFILSADGKTLASGCTEGNLFPMNYSAFLHARENGSYVYEDTHRGQALMIACILSDGRALTVIYPAGNFQSAMRSFDRIWLYLIPMVLLLLVLDYLILLRYQLRPAKALMLTIHNPSMKSSITPYLGWDNEMGRMCRAYEERSEEYKQSLAEIEQLNADRRESEINVLQNQINAHFIYNTLNNIQWLASAGRVEDVIHTAQSLDTLLRACAKNDSDYVFIEDEISYVEAYLSSQKIRFCDVFDYEFHIDPLLLMMKVPKFIVQPLVENSIYHGFLDAHRKNGHIDVSVSRRGYRIVITVYDNGIGIESDRIFQILNNTQKSSKQYMGVAIGNINKRIQLLCGREYGLGIESRYGSFTRVEITIPIME